MNELLVAGIGAIGVALGVVLQAVIEGRRRAGEWARDERLDSERRLRDYNLDVLGQTIRNHDRMLAWQLDTATGRTTAPFRNEDLPRATALAIGNIELLRAWDEAGTEASRYKPGSMLPPALVKRLLETSHAIVAELRAQERRVVAGEPMLWIDREAHPEVFSRETLFETINARAAARRGGGE